MYNGKKLEDCDVVISPWTGKEVDMVKVLKDTELALAFLNGQYPFFGSLLRRLNLEYSFEVGTGATDGTRLIVNPEYFGKLTIREKVFLIMHEVMHCALSHIVRAEEAGFEHSRANVAGDYEINGLLVEDGLISEAEIKKWLYSKKYAEGHWPFEFIYKDNPPGPKDDFQQQQQSQQQSQSQSQSQSQNGQGDNDNTPKSADFIDGWNKAMDDYKAGKIKL